MTRAGQLLEIAYDRSKPVIDEPYSVKRLQNVGVIENCENTGGKSELQNPAACTFNIPEYRTQLADAMLSLLKQANLTKMKVYSDIQEARLSMRNDRILRVSGRSAPITGTLLNDFGSFLDYKFREYDYYVGVYDGLVTVAGNLCGLQYSSSDQSNDYEKCFDSVAKQLFTTLGVNTDPRGEYVFAKLAMREFGREKLLQFAYQPMPPADNDTRIIHDGLELALAAGESEAIFFKSLKAEGFVPTPVEQQAGAHRSLLIKIEEKTLMEQILDDPDSWAAELTRRTTTRLVYLETQAEETFAEREPDASKRESANVAVMGASAFVLQSSNYRYPEYSFAPSTAPDNWLWRNIIPYELGIDFGEGDLMFTWQPTFALSQQDLLGARLSLGFPGGLFQSSANVGRENFLSLGVDYTRQLSSRYISSYGITPTWYHSFYESVSYETNTLGGDVHVSVLENRLRFGVGVRDFDRASDSWFLTLGITDIPGIIYWLTR